MTHEGAFLRSTVPAHGQRLEFDSDLNKVRLTSTSCAGAERLLNQLADEPFGAHGRVGHYHPQSGGNFAEGPTCDGAGALNQFFFASWWQPLMTRRTRRVGRA